MSICVSIIRPPKYESMTAQQENSCKHLTVFTDIHAYFCLHRVFQKISPTLVPTNNPRHKVIAIC